MRFFQGYHAIFVTEMATIGKILDNDICQINQWKIVTLFDARNDFEERAFKQLRSYLDTENNKFYYSFTYDMTHNLQDNFSYSLTQNKEIKEKFEKPDFPLFKWNNFCAENFREAAPKQVKMDKWVIKMIHGYYEEMTLDLFSNIISVHIISRRMIQNAGTRYNRRGLNPHGFPANFVETEQIVLNQTIFSKIKPVITSFVQVRGSVPLYWFQEPSIFNPKPEINIRDADIRMVGSNKHFSDLIGLYGKNIFCLNLMKSRPHKKSNKEEVLSEAFESLMKKMKKMDRDFESLEYEHIDLKNCIKEDQDNFFNMAFKLAESLTNRFGFFELNGFDQRCSPRQILIKYQNGLPRINCVDCLDRTNFMLNIISECALINQLKVCIKYKQDEKLEVSPKIIQNYQSIWRNNGDIIALQYGGSKAHQQKDRNVAEVAFQSVKRHLANTFKDNLKQYQISIFSGEFIPGSHEVWDIKGSSNYEPSSKIIKKLEEGELFGKHYDDYHKKMTIKDAKKLDDVTFLISVDLVTEKAEDQSFKDLLLKPKMFENRKNMISELTEKKILKGIEQKPEDEDKDLPDSLKLKRKRNFDSAGEQSKEEEKLRLQLQLINRNNNEASFIRYFKKNELHDASRLSAYSEEKDKIYTEIATFEEKNEFLFDQRGEDIYEEPLANVYDLYSLASGVSWTYQIGDHPTEEEMPQNQQQPMQEKPSRRSSSRRSAREEEDEERFSKRTELISANNMLTSEIRMVIQNIPNSVKTKVKTF